MRQVTFAACLGCFILVSIIGWQVYFRLHPKADVHTGTSDGVPCQHGQHPGEYVCGGNTFTTSTDVELHWKNMHIIRKEYPTDGTICYVLADTNVPRGGISCIKTDGKK